MIIIFLCTVNFGALHSCANGSYASYGGCFLDRLVPSAQWSREDMKQELHEFLPLYKTRPVGRRRGGMMLDHSFALWYVLRKIQPDTVIESGVFQGHSTWIIRNALPQANIVSIDKNEPTWRDPRAKYFTGKHFVDFNDIRWAKLGLNRTSILCFFDDHQSAVKRIMQGAFHGFRYFMFEDNFLTGDNYSMKQLCRPDVPKCLVDNFGHKQRDFSNRTRQISQVYRGPR